MRRLLLPSIFALWVAGCATQDPMRMTTADGEQFTGVLHVNADRAATGDIDVRSSRTRCLGRWQIGSTPRGTLTMTCGDGRTGIGDIVLNGSLATITGTLGGLPFTGTIERKGL